MKRISLLALGLCATWASGCCCSYYSRHAQWDDSCAQAQDSCVEEYREPRRKGRHKHRRGDKGNRCEVADGGCGECCNSCCDGGCSNCGPAGSPSLPMTYDSAGATMGGGCASGNCGTTQQTSNNSGQMYGGMPFDANSGGTIQSTTSHPVGNEPIMAPPSSGTPITPAPARSQGWVPASSPSAAPSSAPSPGQLPPVSYNR